MTKKKKEKSFYGKDKGHMPNPTVYRLPEARVRLRSKNLYAYGPMKTLLKVETIRKIAKYGMEELGYSDVDVEMEGTDVRRIYGYMNGKRKSVDMAGLPPKYVSAILKAS